LLLSHFQAIKRDGTSGIKIGICIVASETPCRYDRFVSLAGGQAEIAPGANPGSKIRGFGSSKHLDEGHQSRARASLRAGTSRLTERGEKGSKNDEMTRDERVGAILRDHGHGASLTDLVVAAGVFSHGYARRYRGSTTAGTAGTAGRKYSITPGSNSLLGSRERMKK